MKMKESVSRVIVFLVLIALLGSIFNLQTTYASEGYSDIYPRLNKTEKDEVSRAMFWLYRMGSEFHYRDKYSESALIFTSMEQCRVDYQKKNFKYSWDHYNSKNGYIRDPLRVFESYDRGEVGEIDWYLKNYWNIKPSYPSAQVGKIESVESYYHQGYYYKFYHNFRVFSEPVVKKLYDIGRNHYAVEYAIAHDGNLDQSSGTYYAVLKKKNVEGKSRWSAIYNQDVDRSISLNAAINKAFARENIARPTRSRVLVNEEDVRFEAYNIEDNNYFKLRDIASILDGTSSTFEVAWDGNKNAITMSQGKSYTAVGGELDLPERLGIKNPLVTSANIYMDGKKVALKGYNIEGNNYFKLRDLGEVLEFDVGWDGQENTVIINTETP